jgi:hypothetical protein
MLHVVHAVDTEGPLKETLEATFARLHEIFGLSLPPSAETLAKLQDGAYDLGSPALAQSVAKVFSRANLAYNDSWDKIEAMLDRLDEPQLRRAMPDSECGGWRVNWHCLAHYGFDPAKNPRGRDLGAHAVFDRYWARYGDGKIGDSIHWHFHPVPRDRQVNHSATGYFTNPVIHELVSRRVLERLWFPCVNRPGFHTERPDSHWFLEQWIPFDLANNNVTEPCDQPDLVNGRFGDWRRAPADWIVYHPHHDDYQKPGACRRAIARCLYLGGRYFRVTQDEVDKAFARAAREEVVLAFTHHDFRDIVPDVTDVQWMLRDAASRHPSVKWRYADAAEAMRAALDIAPRPHLEFVLEIEDAGCGIRRLHIKTDRAPFGPQPWFCYRTKGGEVFHDNLDRGIRENEWHYSFDDQTATLDEVALIGVATNTPDGRTTVTTLAPATGERRTAHHN